MANIPLRTWISHGASLNSTCLITSSSMVVLPLDKPVYMIRSRNNQILLPQLTLVLVWQSRLVSVEIANMEIRRSKDNLISSISKFYYIRSLFDRSSWTSPITKDLPNFITSIIQQDSLMIVIWWQSIYWLKGVFILLYIKIVPSSCISQLLSCLPHASPVDRLSDHNHRLWTHLPSTNNGNCFNCQTLLQNASLIKYIMRIYKRDHILDVTKRLCRSKWCS